MKRLAIILLIGIFIQGCISASKSPKKLDNACNILKEKRSWEKNLKKVQRKWKVPPHVVLAIIYQESRFNAKARPMTKKRGFWGGRKRASSAYGYSQALDDTWKRYQKANRKHAARRTRFSDSVDFIGWYININHKRNRVSKHDTYKQYLAYHEGMGGFQRRTYLKKPWLIAVAKKTNRRAEMYRRQLRSCI